MPFRSPLVNLSGTYLTSRISAINLIFSGRHLSQALGLFNSGQHLSQALKVMATRSKSVTIVSVKAQATEGPVVASPVKKKKIKALITKTSFPLSLDINSLKDKALKIHSQLLEIYGDPPCPLDHTSPFQLLVSVILSAQVSVSIPTRLPSCSNLEHRWKCSILGKSALDDYRCPSLEHRCPVYWGQHVQSHSHSQYFHDLSSDEESHLINCVCAKEYRQEGEWNHPCALSAGQGCQKHGFTWGKCLFDKCPSILVLNAILRSSKTCPPIVCFCGGCHVPQTN